MEVAQAAETAAVEVEWLTKEQALCWLGCGCAPWAAEKHLFIGRSRVDGGLGVRSKGEGDSSGFRCTWAWHELISCRFILLSSQPFLLDVSDSHLRLAFVLRDCEWHRLT
jgi:hypothetical protein